jgi:uncharacterized membrane protein YphA (DoxX/SURF4 family)
MVAGVFLAAALPKIADPAGFARDIHNYRMIPVVMENVFALILPWIELLAGVAIVLNVAPRGATLLIGALLVLFLVATGQAVIRNLDVDCGCFGTNDASKTGWLVLFRDVAFLALCVLGWPRKKSRGLAHVQVETV